MIRETGLVRSRLLSESEEEKSTNVIITPGLTVPNFCPVTPMPHINQARPYCMAN